MPVHYGLPKDAVAWGALLLAGALLIPRVSSWLLGVRRRWFVLVAAASAFLLSTLYIAVYLRGGPRIIDATTYFLQARAMAEGDLAWTLPTPTTSTTGRFLVRDTLGSGEHVGGIFPPGYPALLALGFLLGSPMIIGPVLAALLAVATTWLADEVVPATATAREATIRVATLLSVASSALRYHTADTMSHGLAALLVVVVLALALRTKRAPQRISCIALGGGLGALFATRPVTALAAIVMWLAVSRPRLRDVPNILIGATPGLALLAAHQHAVTGAWGVSSQQLYYSLSDGPPGCFDYGFGSKVGCRGEHGAFVLHNLPNGYGFIEATKTTLRRLALHVQDPLNDEGLGVVLLVGMVVAVRRVPMIRGLALAPLVLILAYVPFYFDGNYPGGGARFYAEALVIEIVVGTLGLAALTQARHGRQRWPLLLVAFSLVGFGLNAHTDHELLRDREGGRPMWREEDTRHVQGPALLYIDTDHGFALAHHPRGRTTRGDVEIVRLRNDITDLFVFEARGVPAYHHHFEVETGRTVVSAFTPSHTDRLCAATLWPPIAQDGAYAKLGPSGSDGCRTGLSVIAAGPGGGITLDLPLQLAAHSVQPVFDSEDVVGRIAIQDETGALATWTMPSAQPTLSARLPEAVVGQLRLNITLTSPGLGTLSRLVVTAP